MDEFFMKAALDEAQNAFDLGEVPVGAVLVHRNEIIATGYNQVESLKDATAHAEMLCLKRGAERLGNWRLIGATLYCTLEPCAMCAGALILSRVETLVWGAPDLRHGADGSLFQVLNEAHPIHQVTVRRGILKEACAEILQTFFRERRASCKVRGPGKIDDFGAGDRPI